MQERHHFVILMAPDRFWSLLGIHVSQVPTNGSKSLADAFHTILIDVRSTAADPEKLESWLAG